METEAEAADENEEGEEPTPESQTRGHATIAGRPGTYPDIVHEEPQ